MRNELYIYTYIVFENKNMNWGSKMYRKIWNTYKILNIENYLQEEKYCHGSRTNGDPFLVL